MQSYLAEGRLWRAQRLLRSLLGCRTAQNEAAQQLAAVLRDLQATAMAKVMLEQGQIHDQVARRALEELAKGQANSATPQSMEAADELTERAHASNSDAKYADALAIAVQALEKVPGYGPATFEAGMAKLALGEKVESQKLFDRALLRLEADAGTSVLVDDTWRWRGNHSAWYAWSRSDTEVWTGAACGGRAFSPVDVGCATDTIAWILDSKMQPRWRIPDRIRRKDVQVAENGSVLASSGSLLSRTGEALIQLRSSGVSRLVKNDAEFAVDTRGSISFYDVPTQKLLRNIPLGLDHCGNVPRVMQVAADGRWAWIADCKAVDIEWTVASPLFLNLANGKRVQHKVDALPLMLSGDKVLLVNARGADLYCLSPWRRIRHYTGLRREHDRLKQAQCSTCNWQLSVTRDERRVFFLDGERQVVWDFATDRSKVLFTQEGGEWAQSNLSTSGDRIVSTTGRSETIRNVDTGEVVTANPSSLSPYNGIAPMVSPDGKLLATVRYADRIGIVDLFGEFQARYVSCQHCKSYQWYSDTELAAIADGKLRVFDARTGQATRDLPVAADELVLVRPGKVIVGQTRSPRLGFAVWNWSDGKKLYEFRASRVVGLSPSTRYLVTTFQPDTYSEYRMQAHDLVRATVSAEEKFSASCVSWSPDEHILAVGQLHLGRLGIWNLTTRKVVSSETFPWQRSDSEELHFDKRSERVYVFSPEGGLVEWQWQKGPKVLPAPPIRPDFGEPVRWFLLGGNFVAYRMRDGKHLAELTPPSEGTVAHVRVASGFVDFLGGESKAPPLCVIGQRVFPWVLCQDRFRVRNLLKKALVDPDGIDLD